MKNWQFSVLASQTSAIMSCVVKSHATSVFFGIVSIIFTGFAVLETVLNFQLRRLEKENERLKQQKENGSASQNV